MGLIFSYHLLSQLYHNPFMTSLFCFILFGRVLSSSFFLMYFVFPFFVPLFLYAFIAYLFYVLQNGIKPIFTLLDNSIPNSYTLLYSGSIFVLFFSLFCSSGLDLFLSGFQYFIPYFAAEYSQVTCLRGKFSSSLFLEKKAFVILYSLAGTKVTGTKRFSVIFICTHTG